MHVHRLLVNALEIDYVVSFEVNNVDVLAFADSPALTAMTNDLAARFAAPSFLNTVSTEMTTTSEDPDFAFEGLNSFTAERPILRLVDLSVATTQGAPSAQPTIAPADATTTSTKKKVSTTLLLGASVGGLLVLVLARWAWSRGVGKNQVEVAPDPNNLELGRLVAVTPTPQSPPPRQHQHHHRHKSPSTVVPL